MCHQVTELLTFPPNIYPKWTLHPPTYIHIMFGLKKQIVNVMSGVGFRQDIIN